jgi:TrmH family RNA methyltransferase
MSERISSMQNPLVKHLVRLRKDKSYRKESGSILITNKKMLEEISCKVKKLLLLEGANLPSQIEVGEVVEVTESILKKVTGLESPEVVAGEVKMPKESSMETGTHFLALDAVSDPGNMGTLLRTALAMGWDGVYILDNSVDPFNEKVLRASKGALFRLPYKVLSHKEFLGTVQQDELLLADIEGEKIENVTIKGKVILILANEAHGPDAALAKHCKKVTIPMNGKMESLNVAVAGGILMHSIKGGS